MLFKIRGPVRKFHTLAGTGFPPEPTVFSAEEGKIIAKEFLAVGMKGIGFRQHQGAFFSPLVIHMGHSAFGDQGPFNGNGVMKNNILLSVQNPCEVRV